MIYCQFKIEIGGYMKELVDELIYNKKTISTMESCTGGALASAITDIEGASEVLKFSAVTYSNEYKIKMGVSSEVIDTYSVYSIETAREMAINISKFSNSDYGVGITGKLNRVDKNNLYGADNVVFISIYDRMLDTYYDLNIEVTECSRKENKEVVLNYIKENLMTIIKDKEVVKVKRK